VAKVERTRGAWGKSGTNGHEEIFVSLEFSAQDTGFKKFKGSQILNINFF